MAWHRLAPQKCACGRGWAAVVILKWGLRFLCMPCWLAYHARQEAETTELGAYYD